MEQLRLATFLLGSLAMRSEHLAGRNECSRSSKRPIQSSSAQGGSPEPCPPHTEAQFSSHNKRDESRFHCPLQKQT